MKPDQKQTHIGAIPKDWYVKTLGEIASIDSENLSNSTPGDFTFNYISLEDVENGTLKSHSEQKFSRAPSRARRVLKNKDILLSTVRPNLQSHLLFEEKKGNWVCSTGFSTIRCTENTMFPEYIFHYLFHSQIKRQISNLLSGSNYPAINSRDVKSLSIPVPEYEEQRSIATSLSDIDALLESLNSLIAKKRAIKQATMQQLLSGETRVSSPQNDWTDTTLGKIVERFVGGGTPSRTVADYWGGNIPWVSTKDFASFSPYTSQESITRQGLNNSAASLIPAETLLISTRMAVGRTAIYKVDVAINQDIKALIPRAHISQRFLLHWLNHNNHKISSTSNGSTVSGISINDLKRIKIKIPDIHEQNSIAKALDDMDYDISILESRIHKTNSLKQAMMQELLTGRTRLI